VSSRIRLGQRGFHWTKLVVGVARRPDTACCDTAVCACGTCARPRGINSCHSGTTARVRHAARRSGDASGPKLHAQTANRRFATWRTLDTDTEPCIQRRRNNGIVEQHVVSVYTIEQWRGSSSSRHRTAELDEHGTIWSTFIGRRNRPSAPTLRTRFQYEGWGSYYRQLQSSRA